MPQPNQAPIPTPEAPNQVEKELETFEKENEGLETIETKIETAPEAGRDVPEKEILKPELAGVPADIAAEQKKDDLLKVDVKESMERIVSKSYKEAEAADFDPKAVQEIFKKAEAYIGKGYAHIYDEIHDRICAEIDRRAEENTRPGGSR